MKDDIYHFHQTPKELAKELINYIDISSNDILYEPFKGEGAFWEVFPESNKKVWSEIEEGKDYKDVNDTYDWVITNPPFRLNTGDKRVNAFWTLLDHFTQRAKKGIAFLANDSCFCTLTPRRLAIINERGFYITKLVVCSVKKWRGRYYFIVIEKKPNNLIQFLPTNY